MYISKKIENDISQINTIPEILEEITQLSEMDQSLIFKLHLVLDEVLSNIINYAYSDQQKHFIDITFQLNDNGTGIIIVVEDDGIPFNPLEYPAPDINAPVEEREIGNLGIHIVRNTMDSVEYKRQNNRNILTMTKIFSSVK
jgi:serine/threonine-protein kinase RsbW